MTEVSSMSLIVQWATRILETNGPKVHDVKAEICNGFCETCWRESKDSTQITWNEGVQVICTKCFMKKLRDADLVNFKTKIPIYRQKLSAEFFKLPDK